MAALARPVLRGTCTSRCNGGNAEDCLAAPVRPELTALVFPYTSEQFLPESAAVRLAAPQVEHTALDSRGGCARLNPPSATLEET